LPWSGYGKIGEAKRGEVTVSKPQSTKTQKSAGAHTIRIYSENNDFQYVETLRRKREKRQKQREFFVEGVRPLNLALQYHWPIRALLYSRERKLSDWAENILLASPAQIHYELPWSLYAKLSSKSEPSELIALVTMPADDLARIPCEENLLVVVFDRPASPGNLGTIIRSCDALNVHGLIITGHSVDLYDPETISATTGSFFSVPSVRLSSSRDLLPWVADLKARFGEVQVVGSDEKGSVDLDQHNFALPTILVVGNETWGMSAAYHELCDTIVRIPIQGAASSLNVASATSILLYEINRQRRVSRGKIT
jgi:tRNA G18 (ribose-2'-O)-methylase SpoU